MLQNPCKTLSFKKDMVYEIPPGGGGKPYPASGLSTQRSASSEARIRHPSIPSQALYHRATVLLLQGMIRDTIDLQMTLSLISLQEYLTDFKRDNYWALTRENLSSEFPIRSNQNQPAKLQTLARIVNFCSEQVVI